MTTTTIGWPELGGGFPGLAVLPPPLELPPEFEVIGDELEPPPHAARKTTEYNAIAITAILSLRTSNIPLAPVTEKLREQPGLLHLS
jgi:hypothetical protein